MATKSKKGTQAKSAIALPKIEKGEKYIGAILGADGKGHHIILLAGDSSGAWQPMLDWAKKAGGDLPDRVEQALLFRDHKSEFKQDAYWSNTQHAGYSAYAWGQYFSYGDQDYWRKGTTVFAPVRSAESPFRNSPIHPFAMDIRDPQREQEAFNEGQQAGLLGVRSGSNPHELGSAEYSEWERGRRGIEARQASAALAQRARTNPCPYRTGDCSCGGRGMCLDVA
jgi:hypothetical protein